MRQAQHTLTVATRGRGLYDITGLIAGWLSGQHLRTGLLTVFCRHTSASLTIQENADPDVLQDLETFLERTVPEDAGRYRHADEGADDMPAHIRSMLTGSQLTIPVSEGRPALGTWQAIYLFEHRRQPHRRQLVLHVIGD
jgi:secondary thiamine-phosphate synthase enzyme